MAEPDDTLEPESAARSSVLRIRESKEPTKADTRGQKAHSRKAKKQTVNETSALAF